MQDYSAHATRKLNLNLYFAKAKVSYPPREVIFIALKQEKRLELWPGTAASSALFATITSRPPAAWQAPNYAKATRQVPEGIYRIVKLNPNSHYHTCQ